MATGSRDPGKPATCCKVKIRPGSPDWAPHPSVPPAALQGTAGGCRGGGAAPEPGSRPSAQFYFISTHSLVRNNVIASPLGNTAFLCHGNVYPVQLGEFWLWGRIETCSKNGLVKRRSLCLERAQAARLHSFSAARGSVGLCFSLFKGQRGTLRAVKLLTWFLARSGRSVISGFLSS